ncbi:hypothetical protein [Endozoicomonas ascidiicola]|uniref:hypothetical protein n=1 Tax=Endozoicomonas ascidiicola TaxID=1698521 RepID=UPI0008357C4D|nr:hypothetical protein [Endozoicomonas ascidiicola]
MNSQHLLNEIIVPTLQYLGMDSEVARYLLLGTAAQESHMGEYLVQLGGGPAVSVYQIEPATHDDIWENYLAYRPSLVKKLEGLLCPDIPKVEQLKGNLFYSTAIARIHYRRETEPLPELTIPALARYWKRHFNTYEGKGKVSEFEHNFKRFIGGMDAEPILIADNTGH